MTKTAQNISISELVCERLEQKIVSGDFHDGERLDEARLAATFEVSRTPLREAFRMLAALGLVEILPHRGAFVRQPSFSRLVDMFDVMAELEAWCASLAAERITHAQLLALRSVASRCAQALSREDAEAYYAENAAFHQQIYAASGNEFLAEQTRNLQRRLKAYRKLQLNQRGRLAQSMQEHTEILSLLESRQATRAADLMRQHIRIQEHTYEDFLRNRQSLNPA